jgi:hypothetical protein
VNRFFGAWHARRRILGRAPYVVLSMAAVAISACSDSTGPAEPSDLLDRLNALPGVSAREIAPSYGYPRAFELDIVQPVDHDNPGGSTFTQRAYLSHADETAPMVYGPYGYGATAESGQELAGILQGNGLYVTHRYFPGSRPIPTDWSYLDIRQAAADHHRIASLLRPLYAGAWVSAGASKSGMTALFHRRFYPGDVDATVVYVAPFMFDLEDERFIAHLKQTGTPEGRTRIHEFQRRLLSHQDSLMERFEQWFPQNGLTLSLPSPPMFQDAVDSFEWGFWQRHVFDYGDIPDENALHDSWIEHLATVVRLHFASDTWRDYFKAYVYQLYTELGAPAIDLTHLEDLLVHAPLDPRVEYSFPEDLPLVYDNGAMLDVVQWLQNHGDRIIYIYGSVDPWTGGAIELTGAADALKIVQDGADHQVRILGLDDQATVLATLGAWLDMDLSTVTARSVSVPPPEPDLAILLRLAPGIVGPPGADGPM